MTKQRSLPNATRPLAIVVALALEDLPESARGDIRAICQAVKDRASATEWLAWGDLNLAQGVRAVLRNRGAAHVGGRYTEPEQMTFPAYIEWAYAMAIRGAQMYSRAREIASICAERMGRTFDPEVVISAAASGETLDDVIARLAA